MLTFGLDLKSGKKVGIIIILAVYIFLNWWTKITIGRKKQEWCHHWNCDVITSDQQFQVQHQEHESARRLMLAETAQLQFGLICETCVFLQ